MVYKKKILSLKKNIQDSERRIEEIGKDQFFYVLKLSEWLLEIIQNIIIIKARGKRLENAATGPRIKVMKKGIKLSKEIKNLEKKVVGEFSEGHISEEIGKKFGRIIKLLAKNDPSLLKEELIYFESVVELDKVYKKSKKELDEIEETIKRDKNRLEKLLEDLNELETHKIDLEKVKIYKNYLGNLEQIKEFRKKYISSLISSPIIKLLTLFKNNSLEEYNFPSIKEENLEQLIEFFSEDPKLGKYVLIDLCKLFNYGEKKLSHICPETSKFKRIVVGNREWFESILNLERTNFLRFDVENEKIVDFYSNNFKNIRELIEILLKNKEILTSCKEEYARNEKLKEKTKELSKYSKSTLETEINEINSHLELLYSEHKSEETIPKPEEKGLFSKIVSFFRK